MAEKLNTTRQAVSKWENGQGFPETEKLMLLGNIFAVSIDYLLKDDEIKTNSEQDGYYVSREKAESWLSNESRTARNIALGVGCIICSGVPLFFTENSPLSLLGAVIFIIVGLAFILVTAFNDRDFEYRPLKQNKLLFDRQYLSDLTARYAQLKKKYVAMVIFFFVVILFGGAVFSIAESYYHIEENLLVILFLPVLAIALYMLIYAGTMIDAYELLVYNEEYVNKFTTRFMNKIRKLFK